MKIKNIVTTEQQKKEIKELALQGYGGTSISKTLGVTLHQARGWRDKFLKENNDAAYPIDIPVIPKNQMPPLHVIQSYPKAPEGKIVEVEEGKKLGIMPDKDKLGIDTKELESQELFKNLNTLVALRKLKEFNLSDIYNNFVQDIHFIFSIASRSIVEKTEDSPSRTVDYLWKTLDNLWNDLDDIYENALSARTAVFEGNEQLNSIALLNKGWSDLMLIRMEDIRDKLKKDMKKVESKKLKRSREELPPLSPSSEPVIKKNRRWNYSNKGRGKHE